MTSNNCMGTFEGQKIKSKRVTPKKSLTFGDQKMFAFAYVHHLLPGLPPLALQTKPVPKTHKHMQNTLSHPPDLSATITPCRPPFIETAFRCAKLCSKCSSKNLRLLLRGSCIVLPQAVCPASRAWGNSDGCTWASLHMFVQYYSVDNLS